MNKILPFAALLAAMHSTAYGQINKCVDSSGHVVYSQSPCAPGQTSSSMRAPSAAAEPVPPALKPGAKPPPTPEEAFQQRKKERAEAEKKAAAERAEAQQRQEQCQRARAAVAQYEMGGRVSAVNANGERYFLDDNQMAQAKARAQESANQWCK